MKKLFLVAVMALSVMGMSAQKGSWYLGTSGITLFGSEDGRPMTGFSVTDPEGDGPKTTRFGLSPEVGYFIDDNMAIGLGVFYNHRKTGEAKVNTFGFNPYFRYYFLNSGSFRMYGQFDVDYASSKLSADVLGVSASSSISSFGVGVRPGISYNLSDKFAVNATFGLLGYRDVEDNYSEFALNLDASSLQFGFTVSF